MMSPSKLLLTLLICLPYAQVNAEEASDNSLDRFLSEKRVLLFYGSNCHGYAGQFRG